MKIFKSVLALIIMVSFCSTSMMAQNSKKSVKYSWGTVEEPFCFWCPCANDGEGEYLCGTVVFHEVVNSKIAHMNMKGNKLIGSESGRTYTFIRTDNTKLKLGKIVINVRTIGDNGLVTYWQVVGDFEHETFFCR